jgi:hypothetical protein
MNRTPLFASVVSTALGALGAGLVILPAATALADCKPVIAAYSKADATRRFAIYEVDSLDAAPKGEPMIVVIGDMQFTENLNAKNPLKMVKDGYTKGGVTSYHQGDSVRTDEQTGKIQCTPLPDRKVAGEAAAGYHVGSAKKGGGTDWSAYEIWVSRATGLVLSHHEGFRWVYGNQVVAPTPDKIRN